MKARSSSVCPSLRSDCHPTVRGTATNTSPRLHPCPTKPFRPTTLAAWVGSNSNTPRTLQNEVQPRIQAQPEPAQPDTAPCFAKHALLHLASSKLSCWRLSRQERAVNFKSTAAPQHDGDAQHDGESAISFDFAPSLRSSESSSSSTWPS